MKKILFLCLLSLFLFSKENQNFIKNYIITLYKKEYPQIHIKAIKLKSFYKLPYEKDIQKIDIPKSYLKRFKGYARVYLKNKKRVSVEYELKAKLNVLKTKRDIEKNEEITSSILSETSIQFRYISQKPLKKADIKNIKAARFITKDTILTQNMVKRKTFFQKGDIIDTFLKENGIVFEFPAVLTKDANIGETVFVKNKKGKRFKAKIISKERALIIE